MQETKEALLASPTFLGTKPTIRAIAVLFHPKTSNTSKLSTSKD
jgi:hypothetical protein